MAEHLRADVGDNAAAFATLWREETLEYSFRRGLMQHYATFGTCITEALDYCAQRFQTRASCWTGVTGEVQRCHCM
jgi:hypothetical protein